MKATRDSFGEELAILGEKNSRIVTLDADLSKSTKSYLFAKKFPERFFQMGIAEANMIGTAAGLALSGKIPFACSFGCFLTGRYDQVRMSVAYNRANVKLIGTHGGVAIGEDGHSQMALEDLGLVRALPSFEVFQPADDLETKAIIRYVVEHEGPCYIRLTRQKLPLIYKNPISFQAGVWSKLHEGKEVALIGTGALVHSCLEANKKMRNKFTVINASSVKPLDEKMILEVANSHSWIVTAEDHYITNGLGSAVAEVLSAHPHQAKLHRIGITNFGESGEPSEIYKHYELDADGILSRLEKLLNQKLKPT